MTTRTDIVTEFNSSPRVIEVASPSVEMVMQDWVDTTRKQEDSFQGMAFTMFLILFSVMLQEGILRL